MGRVRGPRELRARIGGVGAIEEEPADWLRGLGGGKSDRAAIGGIMKGGGGVGVTREGGVGLEGDRGQRDPAAKVAGMVGEAGFKATSGPLRRAWWSGNFSGNVGGGRVKG